MPAVQNLHEVKIGKRVEEVLRHETFDVIVVNLSRRTRELSNQTVVVYKKQNLLTTERLVVEEIEQLLHLTDSDDRAGEPGAGRRSSVGV